MRMDRLYISRYLDVHCVRSYVRTSLMYTYLCITEI